MAQEAETFKYVVLGGGNASGYAAREFVAGGIGSGELCIVTEEPVVAYERPALSKGYLAPESAARLPGFHTCVGGGGDRQSPDWYKEKGISYKTSTRVVSADVAAHTLTTESGAKIKYDKLIVAIGALPVYLSDFKTPGADLGGVHYLRSEADAADLVSAIKEAKAADTEVVVVGGGYIGMEISAGLATNGLKPTIVMPEDRLMARLFTPQIAQFYEKFYESKGVKILKGYTVTALQGSGGKVAEVVIKAKDGSTQQLPAGLVVVGVGARPNTKLFEGQLDMADKPVGGIKVDGSLRTSNPDVFAVGDVAAFPLVRAGGALARQEHVTNCRSSAAHAVKAILGTAAGPYDYLPYFYSRIFNLSWQFWGSQGGPDTQVIHFGDFDKGKFGAYWVEDGKVIGVFLESATPDEAAAAKKLAADQPAAPTPADSLASQGIAFATSRA